MIFFDTGAWFALSIPSDRKAAVARALAQDIARGKHGAIVSTSFVLDEAATLVRMETDTETAVRLVRGVLARPSVTLVWIDPDHFAAAVELFEQHRDKRWSFTDCTSFVVMRELGIMDAFTFDHNFEEVGFSVLP